MYDINFLTPEYKEKLKRNNIIRKYTIVLGVIFLIQGIIFLGLFTWNKSIEEKIYNEQEQIQLKEKSIAKIKKKSNEIPDLTDKIMVIEDVFKNEDDRISKVLLDIEEYAPLNIWINNINYNNKRVNIEGTSLENSELGLTSERNLYLFEKNLIESGKYKRIDHVYTKNQEKNGKKISVFSIELEVD